MNLDIFVQKTANLFVENRLLKFVVVVLGLVSIFNTVQIERAIKYQRTILIPPKMTGTIEFVEGRPNDSYLRDMARRFINLAATYSPVTARAQFDELLFYFAPEKYPQASNTWYSLAGRIEESRVSSAFYPQKVTIQGDNLVITGQFKQWAHDDQPVESGTRTYVAEYRIDDGRFQLLSLMEQWQDRQLRREGH